MTHHNSTAKTIFKLSIIIISFTFYLYLMLREMMFYHIKPGIDYSTVMVIS